MGPASKFAQVRTMEVLRRLLRRMGFRLIAKCSCKS